MRRTPLNLTLIAALAIGSAAVAQQITPHDRSVDQDRARQDSRPDRYVRSQTLSTDERSTVTQTQNTSALIPVDWILGARVIGLDRDRLGEIHDLIVSPQKDKVSIGLL